MPAKKANINKKQIRVQLDAIFHDPARLQDEIALQNAMGVLMGHLKNPMVDKKSLLADMLLKPNLFEFIFAELSEKVASAMKDYIASVFPLNTPSFEKSLPLALADRLSQYFSTQDDPMVILGDQHRRVQASISVLASLSSLSLPKHMRKPLIAEGASADIEGNFGTQHTPEQGRKSVKSVVSAVRTIDTKILAELGLHPPRSADDIITIEERLLSDLKVILMEYLDVLRRPSLAPNFKGAYVPLPTDPSHEQVNDSGVVDEIGDDAVATSADPDALPLAAALRFNLAECFGEWEIVISARVIRGLRSARMGDPNRFMVYMKKIRELSQGRFSNDNHKNVIENENDVPMYEAKVTNDSCFLYQIDCMREYGDKVEHQVIKIHDLCTYAQLKRDKSVWNNVSKQLSGKGEEYRKRCALRLKEPLQVEGKVYLPEYFEWNIADENNSSFGNLQHLRADEQQDLHERLVLEKFAPFSQALINSILAAEEDAVPVFLMSPTEQDIVRYEGSCRVIGRSGTGKTTTMLFKMLAVQRAYDAVRGDKTTPRPRQLFVTHAQDLAENIERESSKLAVKENDKESRGLFDKEEEEILQSTLPLAFSELTDEHFPLFITFDRLCRLLEADHELARAPNLQAATRGRVLERRKSFVSYHRFSTNYWRHLPRHLTHWHGLKLDAALVFAEIMGVIKGSEGSLRSDKGFLTRDVYVNSSHRINAYTKRKKELDEWDAADRAHTILRGIREVGMQGQKIDFIYVDEAQDNLLIDALIIRSICKKFTGLFWAGDTAQTISAGSSFRFEDLTTFLYRHETSGSTNLSREFQLTTNYRSHGGIVEAAQSIVQLLLKYWPDTVDRLPQEKSIIGGVKPVIFTCEKQDRRRIEQFVFGTRGDQFGAHQCILVRNEAARDELQNKLGDIGTVLTLYESKGLEFNDVLLYNFFQDSTLDALQWRVILNIIPNQEPGWCPGYDPSRHNGVCRELKFLYVAITRARQNLWIADFSGKIEPLRLLWTKKELAENISVAEGTMPRLASASSCREWAEVAKVLFHKRQYSQASRAFARAGSLQARDIAEAYHRRDVAQRMPSVSDLKADTHPTSSRAFLEAASAFTICANATSSTREKLIYHRISDECRRDAAKFDKAAVTYRIPAEEYTETTRIPRHWRGNFRA